MNLFLGLMSGTSMDGIDAAILDVDTNTFIAGLTKPYGQETKKWLQAACNHNPQPLSFFSQLNSLLGREFAQAALVLLQEAKISARDIQAIGNHGQTIAHDAAVEIPYTIQLGCSHTIAELTKIKVVADFRTRDIIVGGKGAPFAPLYHEHLFAKQNFPLAIINIGGVANITWLESNKTLNFGYDIGPGNCLLDNWIKQHLGLAFDQSGEWGATGKPINRLLNKLRQDPFFKVQKPKSIGKEYFSLPWLTQQLEGNEEPADVQATLIALTATLIAEAVHMQLSAPQKVFICGGGVHNTQLMQMLARLLTPIAVKSTQEIGVNPDFIEACLFAWLADKTLKGVSLDLKAITGAQKPAILGTIYPAGIDKLNEHHV